MDSFSAPPSRPSSQLSPEDIKEHLKIELAKEYAQQFIE
ncbi:mitochondrial-like import inner membrane translocase subunit TIM13-like, partial [Trifolium medium]|nr:mitochondrial-like import inner membrane translocase subunit TIM13-like [Trifolium medium]